MENAMWEIKNRKDMMQDMFRKYECESRKTMELDFEAWTLFFSNYLSRIVANGYWQKFSKNTTKFQVRILDSNSGVSSKTLIGKQLEKEAVYFLQENKNGSSW